MHYRDLERGDSLRGTLLGELLTEVPLTPMQLSEIGMLRSRAKQLIDEYVPSTTGDSRFAEIAKDYGGQGTTCGFLCHWLLWRLGCTNYDIVNRSAEGGYTYRIGQNISRIWNLGRFPFASTLNNTELPQGRRPRLGDIVFVKTDPNVRTGAGEHVFVFLREFVENGRTYWESADAGLQDERGQQCARIVRRELILRPRGGAMLGSNGLSRVIMGWIPLQFSGQQSALAPITTSARGDAAYNPSSVRLAFDRAAAIGDGRTAFLNLNGLSMYEMLRALDDLSVSAREELWQRRAPYRNLINMPRVEYAMHVVIDGVPPVGVPGDLGATGQVVVVQEFLKERGLRENAVAAAVQEYGLWGHGTINEIDPRVRARLREYWSAVGINVTDAQAASPAFQAGHPWSAAFISWVMRQAGAGTSFRYAAKHAAYIVWARSNRLSGNASFFKAYRSAEVRPRIGDLVCKWRDVPATYDSIAPGNLTHCDLVTGIEVGAILTLGGNVESTVGAKRLALNANGFLVAPQYFGVIRIAAPVR